MKLQVNAHLKPLCLKPHASGSPCFLKQGHTTDHAAFVMLSKTEKVILSWTRARKIPIWHRSQSRRVDPLRKRSR